MPVKRAYSRKASSARLGPYSRKLLKKAYAEEKRWPSSVYGKAHIMRASKGGGADVLENYGASARLATAQQLANRRHTGWTGRGGYNLAKAYRQSGLGKFVNPVLSAASNRAVSMIGSGLYTGRGEYDPVDSVSVNNLVSAGSSDAFLTRQQPSMSSAADETGAVTICHREYMQDVYAPGIANSGVATAFENYDFPLNPGLQSTFVFLSQIAQNFDEYEFVQLLFHYRSTTTDIGSSTTGQCGTVIMSTNYNASSPPFEDKQSMIEYAHSHSCKVTEHMTHGVECDPRHTALSSKLYVRSNPVVTNQDLKTYDHGLFQLAIANCPPQYNGLPIGELWCEYTVVLRKPKLFTSRGLEIDQDMFVASGGNNTASADAIPKSPLGSMPALGKWASQPFAYLGQQNNIGCELVVTGGNSRMALSGGIGPQLYGFVNTLAMGTLAAGQPLSGAAGDGYVQIVFPAYYTSNVAIKIKWASLSTTNALLVVPLALGVQGNIVGVADMYGCGNVFAPATAVSGPQSVCVSAAHNVNVATGQYISQMVEIHCFVRQSTNGIDNVLTIKFNNTLSTPGVGSLTISQYQAQGISAAPPAAVNGAVPPLFVNQSGVVSRP